MSRRPPRSAGYARAVELELERLLQRPVVLSPRDWTVLGGWHARGIPIELVLEALGDLASRKKGAPPRSLSYFVRAVEESWRTVLEGRALRIGERAEANSDEENPWRAALRTGDLPQGLARVLEPLTRKAEEGHDAAELDAELDRLLVSGIPAPAAFREAEREALEVLAAYRNRMSETVWERTLHHALADRMRLALGLPRLRGAGRVL